MLEPWALGEKRLKKKLGLWLYQWKDIQAASALQATAEMEAAHIRRIGFTGPLAVIANGVSIPIFDFNVPRPSGGRRRLLFLSRIHPKKGILELVRAVAALRTVFENGRWFVTIAGPDEGKHLEMVKREARRLGVDSLLEFPGSVENEAKWDLYRSSELFVLPTYSENFGLVVAEALGCGIPVITTREAPWEELLTRNCGWWFNMGQKELEVALREALLSSPEALAQMGQRGSILVLEKYSWNFTGLELRKLYLWILGQRHRPGCVQEFLK